MDTPKFVYSNARPLFKILNQQLAKRLRPSEETEADVQAPKPKPQKTSLNSGQISDKRIVAYLNLPMAEIKALRTAYDCSINDLALFISSMSLEYYFESIGETVDFDLIAGMPISTRAADDHSAGNALRNAMVNLHNTVPDPKQRLASIVRDTREIKASVNRPGNEKDSDEPSIDLDALGGLFSPIILDAAFYLVSRFALLEKIPTIGNVLITNVPGPGGDLFCSGARVVGNIPMAPFFGPFALTITISSTSDVLSIGYHGCGETIKDKELLVRGAERAFDTLKKNAARKPKAKPKAKKAKAGPRKKAPRRG